MAQQRLSLNKPVAPVSFQLLKTAQSKQWNACCRLSLIISCFFVLIFQLVGCNNNKPTTNPKAPKEASSVTKMDVQNDKFLSTVNVPVAISLPEIEQQLNQQVNGLVYEDNSLTDNDNDQFMTKVWKREPIRLTAQTTGGTSNLFRFHVPLRIWVKAGVNILGFTRYQETEFSLDLKFITQFSIASNWRINTQTSADGYDWIKKPTMKVAGLDIPVTSIVGRIIDKNLGKITKQLDEQIREKIDLKAPVLQAWNTVRQPYLLSEEYRTWLLVVPRRVLMAPFQLKGNVLHSKVGLEGYTLTQTGAKPDVKPAVDLPDLLLSPQMPDDFRIQLLAEMSYQEAVSLANQQFAGKKFDFPGGRSITITKLDIYPSNNYLIVKADLKGSLEGVIYLRGQPFYDTKTRTIYLRELTYDLDTRNVLYRAANWLLQGSFARMLEKQLTFPVGDQIDEAKKALQARLTNNSVTKGVILNGKITQVTPDQVYLTADALLAVVHANGQVNVKVEGL